MATYKKLLKNRAGDTIIPVVDDRTQSTDTPVFERVAKGVASVDH